MTESPNPIIQIRGLSAAYVSRSFGWFGKKEIKPVLNNINLDIASAEIFGLTGESGCGKTTLARCILGLIDYEGEIIIDRQKQDGFDSRHNIQMVFQDTASSLNPVKKIGWLLEEPLVIKGINPSVPHSLGQEGNLRPTGSVEEHVRASTAATSLRSSIHRFGAKEQRMQKVDEMLTRVGLDSSCKTRRVHELSGGQKQRVCIGRALMLQPKILIADEALSSLDVSAGAQILNLFRELRGSLGLTIIFISHNTGAVEYLCDRALQLK
jgi:ABC-type dipeptide/oligopeptide/nickel transport system ATPase subunit